MSAVTISGHVRASGVLAHRAGAFGLPPALRGRRRREEQQPAPVELGAPAQQLARVDVRRRPAACGRGRARPAATRVAGGGSGVSSADRLPTRTRARRATRRTTRRAGRASGTPLSRRAASTRLAQRAASSRVGRDQERRPGRSRQVLGQARLAPRADPELGRRTRSGLRLRRRSHGLASLAAAAGGRRPSSVEPHGKGSRRRPIATARARPPRRWARSPRRRSTGFRPASSPSRSSTTTPRRKRPWSGASRVGRATGPCRGERSS